MILKSRSHSAIDGTLKYQIKTDDDYIIEACVVFFWEKSAPINICISTQIGCECSCSFCITGYKRYIRNLSSNEIIDQVILVLSNERDLLKYNFEITYMGTGEPLQNWENVFSSSIYFSNTYPQLHRINISSIFPRVDIPLENILSISAPVHFQYSLHFITDKLRREYFRKELAPIASVIDRLNFLYNISGNEYCINYILFDSINDRLQDAEALIQLIQPLPAYLKISKYCPIDPCDLKPSANYDRFTSMLSSSGVRWKSFESKGVDIHAACGHLLSDIQF